MNDQLSTNYETELKQLSQFLTYRVSRLHGKLNAQASKILRASVGISLNQWRMIAFIGGTSELTASELISYTGMDKGMVSRNVKTLFEMGYVKSKAHSTDTRLHILSLTPEGRKVFDKALPIMRRRQAHLKAKLSETEIAIFQKVMDDLEIASEETDI